MEGTCMPAPAQQLVQASTASRSRAAPGAAAHRARHRPPRGAQGTDTPGSAGIIPRAVELILARAAALRQQDWEYSLEASFIEVYNNTLRCGLCV